MTVSNFHAEHCAACEPPKAKSWWRDQGIWGLGLLAAVLILGQIWAAARPAAQVLWGYLARAGWAVALGLLLGGVIEHYVPREYISLWLTGRHRRTILSAAGLGFLASSCSHGCLALSMELYRKGASVPAVITFLLASPWASFSLTLLILSLMGGAGLLIVVLALLVATVTGFVFQYLERRGLLEPNPHTVQVAADFSIGKDLKERFRQRSWDVGTFINDLKGIARGAWGLAQMVLFWVALGFTLSAVMGTTIPHSWWHRFVGPTILGLLTTLGIATAVEVCSEGTAPLAVELYRQTGALGNAFTFLMAGVVTDFTELSVVWTNLGRKTVGWLLVVTLPQVFLLGMLMNWLGR
ncbi:MAG: permease [Candidatus Omnitrophica bacterium]|nr:permease [Candidatus Omnitrophota bacterium]